MNKLKKLLLVWFVLVFLLILIILLNFTIGFNDIFFQPTLTPHIPFIYNVDPGIVLNTETLTSITINGVGFVQDSIVIIGGISFNPISVSNSQIILEVPSTCPNCIYGSYDLYVINNPNDMSMSSNHVNIGVTSPVPVFNTINPTSLNNNINQEIIIKGNNIMSADVNFPGTSVEIKYQNEPWAEITQADSLLLTYTSNSLILHVYPGMIPGTYSLRLKNPGLNGNEPKSNILSISVTPSCPAGVNPPTLTAVTPNNFLNRGDLSMTFIGSGFINGAKLYIGGFLYDLTFETSSRLVANNFIVEGMPSGDYSVAIVNPLPNTCVSASKIVTVNNELPFIQEINPNKLNSQGGNVLIKGSGFYGPNNWGTKSILKGSFDSPAVGNIQLSFEGFYTINSETEISFNIPSGPEGIYDLWVSNFGGDLSNVIQFEIKNLVPETEDNNNNNNNGNVVIPVDEGSGRRIPNNQNQAKQCEDGIDNDSDGLIDFPNDPGCATLYDDSELEVVQIGGNTYTPEEIEQKINLIFWIVIVILMLSILIVSYLIIKNYNKLKELKKNN